MFHPIKFISQTESKVCKNTLRRQTWQTALARSKAKEFLVGLPFLLFHVSSRMDLFHLSCPHQRVATQLQSRCVPRSLPKNLADDLK